MSVQKVTKKHIGLRVRLRWWRDAPEGRAGTITGVVGEGHGDGWFGFVKDGVPFRMEIIGANYDVVEVLPTEG